MPKSLIDSQSSALKNFSSAMNSQAANINALQNMPSEGRNLVDLYSGMRESVGYAARPNSKWRALLDGIFRGAEFAEKQKMTKANAALYNTLLKGAEYGEKIMNSSAQILEKEQKKEMLNQEMSGIATSIYQAAINGSNRSSIDEMGRVAFRGLSDNGVVPQGSSFVSIDPNTMTAIYADPEGNRKFYDMTPLIGENAQNIVKQKIDKMVAEAKTKSANASQTSANASMMRASAEINNMKPENLGKKEAVKARSEQNYKEIKEISTEIEEGDSYIHDLKQIKEVIENSDKVGMTPGAAIKRWWAQKTGQNEELDTISMNLGSTMVGMKKIFKGSTSDRDVENYKQTIVNADKNPQAASKVLSYLISYGTNRVGLLRKKIDAYEEDPTSNLYKKEFTENIAEASEGIKVKDPNTGEIATLDKEDADIAIKRGGIQVQ